MGEGRVKKEVVCRGRWCVEGGGVSECAAHVDKPVVAVVERVFKRLLPLLLSRALIAAHVPDKTSAFNT